MKYSIGEKVTNLLTGKEGIIIGTKEKAYKPKTDPYNRKEIYPDENMDYLFMIKKAELNNKIEYSGMMSVLESHLKKI